MTKLIIKSTIIYLVISVLIGLFTYKFAQIWTQAGDPSTSSLTLSVIGFGFTWSMFTAIAVGFFMDRINELPTPLWQVSIPEADGEYTTSNVADVNECILQYGESSVKRIL